MARRRGVLHCLLGLEKDELAELYTDPWICQAIFRALPEEVKMIILQLLLPTNTQRACSTLLPHHEALLTRLCIVQGRSSASFELSPSFGCNLRVLLAHPEAENLEERGVPGFSGHELEAYTANIWRQIGYFMVGAQPASVSNVPSSRVVSLLLRAGLMQIEGEEALRITDKGLQFLLWDTDSQVWALLLAYISCLKEHGMDLKELLSFLLRLNFLSLGKGYPVADLSVSLLAVHEDMRALGLVFQSNANDCQAHYCPTPMALRLCTPSHALHIDASATAGNRWIDVGTDGRLFCYYQLGHATQEGDRQWKAILISLFARIEYTMAGVLVAILTRASIGRALAHGLSAEDILAFLERNARHRPDAAATAVPEAVADQIHLWQADVKRVTAEPGVLYEGFSSSHAFQAALHHAQSLNALVWASHTTTDAAVSTSPVERLCLFVSGHAHASMRRFLLQQKHNPPFLHHHHH